MYLLHLSIILVIPTLGSLDEIPGDVGLVPPREGRRRNGRSGSQRPWTMERSGRYERTLISLYFNTVPPLLNASLILTMIEALIVFDLIYLTNRAGLVAYPEDFDNPRKGVRVKPPPLVGLYRLVRCIGHGTMGRVYEALDRYDDPVAVKLLAVEGTTLNRHEHDLDAEWESVERFFKEVTIVSLLSKDTDRIARYIDHGITQKDRVHYLVMELVNGETLEHRLEHHSVDIVEALKIASEILRALEPAHALGVVHRDLKPANVMLTASSLKVLDFGVARAFHGNTDHRILIGNLAHMSPEQAEQKGITLEKNPRRLITPASDIFAVGSILYTMLTGRSFFAGITIEEILQAHKETRITPYPAVNCDIPSSVWKILYHSLQHEPGKRMSAAAMRELVEAELRALAVTNDPLRKSSVTSRWDPNQAANDGEASKTLITRFAR